MEYLERIEQMRSLDGAVAPFVKQAERLLLPRYWGKASWRERAETLAMVDWFLRMGESAQGAAGCDLEPGISRQRPGGEAPDSRVLLNAKA